MESGFRCEKVEFFEGRDPKIPEFEFCGYSEGYLSELRASIGPTAEFKKGTGWYEKACEICLWVHDRWSHDGSNTPERKDPLGILREAKLGKSFSCAEYSIVLHAALCALGFKSRVLYLRTMDSETRESDAGHVVIESYLPEWDKWVMFDPQFDVHTAVEGIPLNAVELRNAISEFPGKIKVYGRSEKGKDERDYYVKWICNYLYYFMSDIIVGFPGRRPNSRVILMPRHAKTPAMFQGEVIGDHLIPTPSYRSFYPGQQNFYRI